jgi:hypothetical protein
MRYPLRHMPVLRWNLILTLLRRPSNKDFLNKGFLNKGFILSM